MGVGMGLFKGEASKRLMRYAEQRKFVQRNAMRCAKDGAALFAKHKDAFKTLLRRQGGSLLRSGTVPERVPEIKGTARGLDGGRSTAANALAARIWI